MRSALQAQEAEAETGLRLPQLVPGTLVVAYLICLGRWGSYLGVPSRQLYVTDLMLLVSVGWTLVRYRAALIHHLRGRMRSRALRLLPVLIFVTWALVRGVPGLTKVDGLRDLAPYVYVGVLAMLAVLPHGHRAGRASVRTLIGALVVHAVWVTAAQLWPWPGQLAQLPLLGDRVRVMEIRVDFDGAMLAVLAGLALYGASRVQRRDALAGLLLVCAWCSVMVLTLASRAALIALVVAYAVGCLSSLSSAARLWRRHPRLLVAGLVVLVVSLAVITPQTPTYKRLTGDPAYTSAAGTTAARQAAWTAVVRYIDQQPSRVVVGVGMGPDFLKTSGAATHYQYVGGPTVRQPHNFGLNTYARLGLVGLALLLWVYFSLARAMVQVLMRLTHSRDNESVLSLTCVLMCGVLFVTSMLGVIIESPFGAIPFGWAAGLLLVGGATSRKHRPEPA